MFLHSTGEIRRNVEQYGLRRMAEQSGGFWQVMVFEGTSAA
ncbi:MAG TPA: hypothetical protein VEK76_00180 [Candidatus Binatia bacterium]|nr:hypothetical protein [Candidatus Binatia bacterium]